MKYDWNYLFELGYEASELEAFERQGWAEGVYETLSDPDLIDSYQDNARYMLRFFSKSATLRLMVGYSSAFMISHETFVSRIEQVAELFGKNWQDTVIELYRKDQASIMDAVGYLRPDDWNKAIAEFTLSS